MSELSNDLVNVQVGDKVTGTVVKIEDKQALVDIRYKTEGILPISELSNLHVETISDYLKVGDTLNLQIKKVEDEEVILSKKAVDSEAAWESLTEKLNSNETFETEIKEVVKGGLVVDVGLRGFIPASMVETYYVEDFSEYLNKVLEVKVVDLDKEKNRVILSHRAVLEEEASEKKQQVLESLKAGQVLEGTVQRLTNFGAFVDIGGIDGLVHISQLAHEHVEKASDVVHEGDQIKVEVLSVDLDNERISLSRKNTLPGPWADISTRVKSGDVLSGVVKRLVDFGAFVEVLPGVEGLVHISEVANRHIAKPEDVLEVGQEIDVKVLDVNEAEKRVSLSIRALEKEAEAKEVKSYEPEPESSGFQLGDLIGDQLKKYK